jgi:hypothetical protein
MRRFLPAPSGPDGLEYARIKLLLMRPGRMLTYPVPQSFLFFFHSGKKRKKATTFRTRGQARLLLLFFVFCFSSQQGLLLAFALQQRLLGRDYLLTD